MNEVDKKIQELNDEAEFLLECLNEDEDFYKVYYLLDEDFEKLIELKNELIKKINKLNKDAAAVKDTESFNKVYLGYKSVFDEIYDKIVCQRSTSLYNLAKSKYENDANLLIENTKKVLEGIDEKEQREAFTMYDEHTGKKMTTKGKVNHLFIRILTDLNVEQVAINNFYKDTVIHKEFSTLIINKIESILQNVDVRKIIRSETSQSDKKGNTDKEIEPKKENKPVNYKDETLLKYAYAQSHIINEFINCNSIEKNNPFVISKDDIANRVSYSKNDVSLTFNLNAIKNFRLDPMVKKTLIMIIHELIENLPYGEIISDTASSKYQYITLHVKQFMEDRQLGDQNVALRQLKNSLDVIAGSYTSYSNMKDKLGNEKEGGFHIIDNWEHVKGEGYAKIKLNEKFIQIVANSSHLTEFNKNLYAINDKTHPSCFNVGYELLVNARRNQNKKSKNKDNKYVIKVEKLLNVCRNLDITRFQARCFNRFEATMDLLKDNYFIIKSWEYCLKGRKKLSEKDFDKLNNYNDFKELYIVYELEMDKQYIKPKD